MLVLLLSIVAAGACAADSMTAGFSLGIGANRYLVDAGTDAVDLSPG